jgi:RHS repeat-associated protein
MKRTLERLRHSVASLAGASGLLMLMLLLAGTAAAQPNYCNNPVPPCSTDDPLSPCYKAPPPPPQCEPRVCNKCTKSPCYVGSGVYVRDELDLTIAGVGEPIEVGRQYLSTKVIDGELGRGWTSGLSARLYYAVFLQSAPATYQKEAVVRLHDGNVYRFVENAGAFTPPQGRFDTLIQNPDGTFDLLIQRTRAHMHFAADGNLESIVDDYGNAQSWSYLNGRLDRVTDTVSGRYITITHGADGRISDVTDMTGRNVHYTYDANGVLVSVTNPAAQTTTYGYAPGKYAPLLTSITDHWGRNVSTIVFDTKDRAVSYTDRGETFAYTYGSASTSKTDSSGNIWQFPFGTAGLVSQDQPPGGGAATQSEFYPSGLIQMQTDPAGVKTRYTYNARGNPLTITADYQGATAVEWRFVYDATYPDNVLSVKPYDPATGLIHPHWEGMRYEYYGAGAPAPGAVYRSFRLDNDGTTSRLETTFTHDARGRILSVANASGHLTELTYDSSGNLTRVERPANNDAGTRPAETYVYDSLGRVTSATNALGHVTTYTYDVLDRVLSETLPKPTPGSPLTFTRAFFYDEYESATQLLFVRSVDANARSRRIGYDQYGQPLRIIDEAGNITRNVFTKGLFTARIDANNYTTAYAYDARRRPSTVTFPDGTSELTTYNADDTIASKRNRLNQTTTFTYDRHKRMTVTSYPNGGTITNTYQGQKLTQVVDTFASPSETHTWTYDASFRAVTNAQGSRGTVSMTYGVADRPATMTVAGGAVSTYDYYPDGSLRTVAWSPVSGTFRYDYSLRGQPLLITFPNGQTRSYAYDQQGRITQVTNVHPTSGTLASFSYGYDTDAFTGLSNFLGMRTSMSATVPALSLTNAVTNLGYDTRYQLTRADYPAAAPYSGVSATWAYDAAGHRTSATVSGSTANYVYNKFGGNPLNGIQLQSDGGNTYTYNAEGNVTARSGSRGNFTFSWDYENRLRSVNGDVTAGYGYDYYGRRTVKTVGGASTSYLFAGQHPVAESGASPAEYLYGVGLDQPLAMMRGGQVHYYAVDGLDSVVALNDTAGTVQNSFAWDAWGTAVSSTSAVTNPFGFTARDVAEAGLHYYRNRYYEPAVGRFASEDPLQELMALSGRDLYGYVNNSPAMFTDPTGLECYSWTFGGDWRLTKTVPGETWWTVVERRPEPYVPRIPILKGGRIPFGGIPGGQYVCYWRQWQRFTYHMERDASTTTICTCPPHVFTTTWVEKKIETDVKRIRSEMVVTHNAYCNFTPPK